MATSLTSGEAIRNDSVTPSGTPAATNPRNAGTAEQEQNGVTTPSPAAITLPRPSRRPPSSALVRSRVTKLRSTVTAKMIPTSSRPILTVSARKKCTAEPDAAALVETNPAGRPRRPRPARSPAAPPARQAPRPSASATRRARPAHSVCSEPASAATRLVSATATTWHAPGICGRVGQRQRVTQPGPAHPG